MNPDRKEYLNLRSKPGRVTAEEAGWHLGFNSHDVPILIGAGLLVPLGKPAENGVKFFLSRELDELNQNRAWFEKACDTVVKYWRDRNQQRPTVTAKRRWPHRFTSNPNRAAKPLRARAVRPHPPKKP